MFRNNIKLIILAVILVVPLFPKSTLAAAQIYVEDVHYTEESDWVAVHIVHYGLSGGYEYELNTSMGGFRSGRGNLDVDGSTFWGFECNGTVKIHVGGQEGMDTSTHQEKTFTIGLSGVQNQPEYCAQGEPSSDINPDDSINGDGSEPYFDADGSKDSSGSDGSGSTDGGSTGGSDGSGDGSTGGTGGTGETCDSCAVFECPGWSAYMGKLNDIKQAIPPPPNWNEVADTFRDSIAPRIKQDMEDLFGYAPEPPTAPTAPTPPEMPIDLDDRGIEEPTGEEAPGLEEATFDEEDIKNEAPVIPEREDPTGGFEIDDPLTNLPSQEEFKENIPEEGSAPIPGAPKEPENIAPEPTEPPNAAPTPSEPENTAPTPSEPENTAPTPTESSGTAPTPSDDTGAAPLPGDSGSGYPMPGDSTDSPPIPTEEGTAPIPGQ